MCTRSGPAARRGVSSAPTSSATHEPEPAPRSRYAHRGDSPGSPIRKIENARVHAAHRPRAPALSDIARLSGAARVRHGRREYLSTNGWRHGTDVHPFLQGGPPAHHKRPASSGCPGEQRQRGQRGERRTETRRHLSASAPLGGSGKRQVPSGRLRTGGRHQHMERIGPHIRFHRIGLCKHCAGFLQAPCPRTME